MITSIELTATHTLQPTAVVKALKFKSLVKYEVLTEFISQCSDSEIKHMHPDTITNLANYGDTFDSSFITHGTMINSGLYFAPRNNEWRFPGNMVPSDETIRWMAESSKAYTLTLELPSNVGNFEQRYDHQASEKSLGFVLDEDTVPACLLPFIMVDESRSPSITYVIPESSPHVVLATMMGEQIMEVIPLTDGYVRSIFPKLTSLLSELGLDIGMFKRKLG